MIIARVPGTLQRVLLYDDYDEQEAAHNVALMYHGGTLECLLETDEPLYVPGWKL